MELSGPGVQYIADNQLYNSIITAHAILMIFFMVEIIYIFNFKSQFACAFSSVTPQSVGKVKLGKINDDSNNALTIGNNNNNQDNQDPEDSKHKYVKVLVHDPFNNRDIILKVTKKQKGVYVWESLDGEHVYVGHSINLYNRISSYFMPSILQTKARRVLRYLNKHGFSNMKLTIYIMDEESSLEQVVALEQHFIDSLKSNLNVDLPLRGPSGSHKGSLREVASSSLLPRLYISSWLLILYLFPQTNQILLDIADSVLFISSLDSYATFTMFFPTCKLFKKPSKDCKIKVSTTPLVIYSFI